MEREQFETRWRAQIEELRAAIGIGEQEAIERRDRLKGQAEAWSGLVERTGGDPAHGLVHEVAAELGDVWAELVEVTRDLRVALAQLEAQGPPSPPPGDEAKA